MKKKLLSFLLAFLTAFSVHPGISQDAFSQPERFIVISDTHLTESMENRQTTLDAVIAAAKGQDAVLLLGDNTNNSHTEEHEIVLSWAKEIRQNTNAEVYIVPGNHDYNSHFGREAFRDLYRQFGLDQSFSRDDRTASYAVMTAKGTCLVMLDTNQFDKGASVLPDGGISEITLDWLKGVLESLPDGTMVFACGHHSLLAPKERTPGASALCHLLRAYGVCLYICGHDHGFATVEQNGLRQITVGQPQVYPGWIGMIEKENDAFVWHTKPLYDTHSSAHRALSEAACILARSIARGTLAATQYADDEDAIGWFANAFMLYLSGEMTPDVSTALLADENAQKWREITTRTVVKDWILNLLENCPEDVRHITVPSSGKHSPSP